MEITLTQKQFLQRKADYSRFLVHLTRSPRSEKVAGTSSISAKDVLKTILEEQTLRALDHHCLFTPALRAKARAVQDRFNVLCFTETPIHQVQSLLNDVGGRQYAPEPYGLVFDKDYIRERGGNPVFYVTKEIAKPLWRSLYFNEVDNIQQPPDDVCRLLSLVTVCEPANDWHWEREWRIAGDLRFRLPEVYCGLCPEQYIEYFENKYQPLKFISPEWALDRILAKAIGK